MPRTLMDQLLRTSDDRRLFEQERVILDVTEMICELMEQKGVTRRELAEGLGTSKANVTQMLNGTRNMTLRTVSDVLFRLGCALQVGYAWLGDVSATERTQAQWGRSSVQGGQMAELPARKIWRTDPRSAVLSSVALREQLRIAG